MENIFNSIAPVVLFVSSLLGLGVQPEQLNPAPEIEVVESVELGLSETSPLGAEGGFAIPASGSSLPGCGEWIGGRTGGIDGQGSEPVTPGGPGSRWISTTCVPPTITVDKPLVRYGDPVIVTWATNASAGCTLSSNVTSLAPLPVVVGTGGSRTDIATGEETYTITCTGGSDSVTVKVLPRIQET